MESSGGSQTPFFQIPAYVLNDLCTRFIINLPDEVAKDIIRVFFQIELAHWFYLDFYCPDNAELKPIGIKEFSTQIFRHCPKLVQHLDNFDRILGSWKEYKQAVPTYGAILLDPTLQHCLLVQGFWDRANWGFPKGKINENEAPVDCAVREVLEETGFDIGGMIDANLYLEHRQNDQIRGLYIIPGVPMDTEFQAQTRQEIKSFGWFRIDTLPSHKKDTSCKQLHGLSPNSFFMVIPFVKGLRHWIHAKLNGIDLVATGSCTGVSAVQSAARYPSQPPAAAAAAAAAATGFADQQRHLMERRRQKQQQSPAGYLDKGLPSGSNSLRPKSESPPHNLHATGMSGKATSPRHGKKITPNIAASPTKAMAKPAKPIKILKRDPATNRVGPRNVALDALRSSDPRHTEPDPIPIGIASILEPERGNQNNSTRAAQKPESLLRGKPLDADFVCPAWRDFKLDINLILAAMFPSANTRLSV